MASFSVNTGLASGLDIGSMISGMMEIERRPVTMLESDKSFFQAKKQAIDSFSDKLSALQKVAAEFDGLSDSLTRTDEETFLGYSSSSSDSSKLAVTAGDDPQLGTYDVEIHQLAQVGRIVHSGAAESDTALSATDTQFKFKMGDDEFSIDIEGGVTTLEDLQEEIDGIEDIRASIINTGTGSDPYKLVITGEKIGADNDISISADSGLSGFADADFLEADRQHATDAIIVVDGVEVHRDSNSISDVIDGVTIDLKANTEKEDGGGYDTITVETQQTSSQAKQKIDNFVNAFNDVLSFMDDQGYNQDTQKTGILGGDSILFSVESRMRNIITESVSTSAGSISAYDIGLTLNGSGKLTFDSSKFAEALEENPEQVTALFMESDDGSGIAAKFTSYLESMVDPDDGLLESRKESCDNTITRLTEQISRKEEVLTKREERLRAQFTAMEMAISSLQSNQTYLDQLASFSTTDDE